MESKKAVFAAFAANLSIAAAKFAAWFFTGSSALLSEAIHSVADSTNQVLLLVGDRHAKSVASRAHPFGRSGARYVYGFLVSIIFFAVGGVFSLYEGIHKIQHPEPLQSAWIAFAVLAFAAVAEGFALRTALHETRHDRRNRSILRYLRTSRDPEGPVLLLEDSGALLGLMIAFAAVTLSTVTGNGVWDGIGSVLIGLLLITAALLLATETGSMLIGESAVPEESDAIAAALPDGDVLKEVIHLRTLHVGPQVLLVAAKMAVTPGTTIEQLTVAIDAAERRVRAAVPDAKYIYLEPDLLRAGVPVNPMLYPHNPDDE